MRRLLWALALAVPFAACGDDGVDELGDADAATEARDEGCYAVAIDSDPNGDGANVEWMVAYMWRDDAGGIRADEPIAVRIPNAAEACAIACEWEADECGGARDDCGEYPSDYYVKPDGRCADE